MIINNIAWIYSRPLTGIRLLLTKRSETYTSERGDDLELLLLELPLRVNRFILFCSQGFFVCTIYCFANSEIQRAFRKKMNVIYENSCLCCFCKKRPNLSELLYNCFILRL